MFLLVHSSSYLFINDATTPATLTLPLHDALPIWARRGRLRARRGGAGSWARHEHDGGPLRKPDRTSRNRGFSTTASKSPEPPIWSAKPLMNSMIQLAIRSALRSVRTTPACWALLTQPVMPSLVRWSTSRRLASTSSFGTGPPTSAMNPAARSEEHTSELQSR